MDNTNVLCTNFQVPSELKGMYHLFIFIDKKLVCLKSFSTYECTPFLIFVLMLQTAKKSIQDFFILQCQLASTAMEGHVQ